MFIPLVKRKLGACSSLRSRAFWEYIGLITNLGMQITGTWLSSGWEYNLFQKKFGPLECLAVLMLIICNEVRVLGSRDFTLQSFLIMSLGFQPVVNDQDKHPFAV